VRGTLDHGVEVREGEVIRITDQAQERSGHARIVRLEGGEGSHVAVVGQYDEVRADPGQHVGRRPPRVELPTIEELVEIR
jgi:hypothetical protein